MKLLRRNERGQSVVEMAMILPILLMIVLGTLEFGMVFDHTLSLEYASREGARTGAALAAGGETLDCDEVDDHVIAAVQRVLKSPGSDIDLDEVSRIRIYDADANGDEAGAANQWEYNAGAGPAVDGANLDFTRTSHGWDACGRDNGSSPDSIGVSVTYTYRFRTPLTSLLGVLSLTLEDRTVMQLNPTD